MPMPVWRFNSLRVRCPKKIYTPRRILNGWAIARGYLNTPFAVNMFLLLQSPRNWKTGRNRVTQTSQSSQRTEGGQLKQSMSSDANNLKGGIFHRIYHAPHRPKPAAGRVNGQFHICYDFMDDGNLFGTSPVHCHFRFLTSSNCGEVFIGVDCPLEQAARADGLAERGFCVCIDGYSQTPAITLFLL